MDFEIYNLQFDIKYIITLLAIIAGLCVITTKNAIISVFNLIVLYILVAFYLIHIGLVYIGISYVVIYIGAIAILFLFVIMMIDVEVLEKKNNNYLFLLFFLLVLFLYSLKNILYNLGLLKIKNIFYINDLNHYINDNDNDAFRFFLRVLEKNTSFFKDSLELIKDVNNNSSMFLLEDKNILSITHVNNNVFPDIVNNNISYFNIINTFHENDTNLLLIAPDWDSAISNVSQISAIGEVLYSTYNTYIYIVSVILLLAMLGAIILTSDHNQETKFFTIVKNNTKTSNILVPFLIIINLLNKKINNYYNYYIISIFYINIVLFKLLFFCKNFINKNMKNKFYKISIFTITPFYDNYNIDTIISENILGTLPFYVISNIIIGLLLLFINTYFSISVKYLDKGGGFECGFTSFLQTRERYNIAFYRVSLLFLIFDLEIILTFPFPAIYQKDENIAKNNILVFLFLLFVGFIYELKEGALNIVKTAHPIEIKVSDY